MTWLGLQTGRDVFTQLEVWSQTSPARYHGDVRLPACLSRSRVLLFGSFQLVESLYRPNNPISIRAHQVGPWSSCPDHQPRRGVVVFSLYFWLNLNRDTRHDFMSPITWPAPPTSTPGPITWRLTANQGPVYGPETASTKHYLTDDQDNQGS